MTTPTNETVINNIQGIKSSFLSALDDYKQFYVVHKMDPDVEEYNNNYINSRGQLRTLEQNLAEIYADIVDNINVLTENTITLNEALRLEKILHTNLTTRINSLDNTKNGSEILIDNSKTQYNTQFYSNVWLITGILAMSVMLKTGFSEN